MKIEPNILQIIDSGRTDGNLYFLPAGQLDHKTYLDVNKVLEAIGGRWRTKVKAHVFESPIEDAIENVLLTGEVTDRKKELQFFETPADIALRIVDLCGVDDLNFGDSIWEPEAGRGEILKAITSNLNSDKSTWPSIYWCEIDQSNRDYLEKLGIGQKIKDNCFEIAKIWSFNRIVMNPPFSRQQDIDHVTHALEFLDNSGIIVSVMSPAIKFRTNRKTNEFRALLKSYRHEIIDLPEGSFKESGTMIKTVILRVWK